MASWEQIGNEIQARPRCKRHTIGTAASRNDATRNTISSTCMKRAPSPRLPTLLDAL